MRFSRAARYAYRWKGNEDMEELEELVDDLLNYYELSDAGDWPMDSVWSGGVFHRGVISDELHQILVQLKELRDGED